MGLCSRNDVTARRLESEKSFVNHVPVEVYVRSCAVLPTRAGYLCCSDALLINGKY